jgi:SAM-dependent methyltransferase
MFRVKFVTTSLPPEDLAETDADARAWLGAWSELMETANAFRRSCLLFTAVQLGVFPMLADAGMKLEELSTRIGIDASSTGILLNGLVATSILRVEDGCYSVPRHYKQLLGSGADTMLPDLARAARENLVWLRASEILTGQAKAPREYSRELLDGRIVSYPALMKFNRYCASAVLEVAAPHVQRARRVLDLGGGDGIFASLILQANPEATYTILEVPGGADSCIVQQGSDRFRIVYGDACNFEPGEKFDLIIVNELLELFGGVDKERIVRRAKVALAPNGAIVIVKFTLTSDGIEPKSSALFSLRMRLKSESYLESDAEVFEMLRAAGCECSGIVRVGPLKSIVIGTSAGF